MRTLLLAMTVLAAAETIVHAQDCTTVPADETVSLSYQPYAGYSAWAQSPKSYGHPGCDRFVVDIVGNRDRTIWAGATVDIPEAAAQCTLTVVKETIWGWVPPVCWKMGSCFPGYWVQVADKSASGDEPATSAVCSISAGDGFSSQYDTIRIAAIAEQRDLFDSGYSKVGPVDVTDLAE